MKVNQSCRNVVCPIDSPIIFQNIFRKLFEISPSDVLVVTLKDSNKTDMTRIRYEDKSNIKNPRSKTKVNEGLLVPACYKPNQ